MEMKYIICYDPLYKLFARLAHTDMDSELGGPKYVILLAHTNTGIMKEKEKRKKGEYVIHVSLPRQPVRECRDSPVPLVARGRN